MELKSRRRLGLPAAKNPTERHHRPLRIVGVVSGGCPIRAEKAAAPQNERRALPLMESWCPSAEHSASHARRFYNR
jgi:hypothetical protein